MGGVTCKMAYPAAAFNRKRTPSCRWRKLTTTKRLSARGLPDGPEHSHQVLGLNARGLCEFANPTVELM
jgi:hypothetical protein